MDRHQFQNRMERVEELIAAIQEHGNPVVRASAVDLVRALLDIHRAGLADMLEHIVRQGERGQAIVNELLQNDLVSRLLLLHGLHPVDLPTRLRQALERSRSWLRVHGAEAEVERAAHEAVTLRVRGGGEEIYRLLEQAILDAAPDVLRIEFIDGDAPAGSLVSLPLVRES